MSTVTPPPNVSEGTPQQVTILNVKVPTPPPELLALQRGTVIRARVSEIPQTGLLQLSGDGTVDNAVFNIATNINLPLKTNISLKIVNFPKTGGVILKIMTINGKPPLSVISQEGKLLINNQNLNESISLENTTSQQQNKIQQTQIESQIKDNVIVSKSSPVEALVLRSATSALAKNVSYEKNEYSWINKIFGTSSVSTNPDGISLPEGTNIKLRIAGFSLPENTTIEQKNSVVRNMSLELNEHQKNIKTGNELFNSTINTKTTTPIQSMNESMSMTKNSPPNILGSLDEMIKQAELENENNTTKSSANFMLSKQETKSYENKTVLPTKADLENIKSLRGKVINETITGKTLVQTNSGTIAIPSKTPLPAGTNVFMEVLDISLPPNLSINQTITTRPAFFDGGSGWPAFEELTATLKSEGHEQLLTSIINKMPQPNNRLATNLISFINAIKNGNVSSWLGQNNIDNINSMLGHKGTRIIRQIDKEIKQISRKAEQTNKSWSSIEVPFMSGQAVQRITAIFRRFDGEFSDGEPNKPNKKIPKGSMRFIINLNLSRLGEMQIDGLANKDQRILDLMIRTHKLLPDNIPLDIQSIFRSSLQAMAYAGNISFSVTEEFPDVMRTKSKKNKGRGIIV